VTSNTAPAVSLLPIPTTVTVFAFTRCCVRCRARLAASPSSEASSKRQGDGQRFQKKAMNTTLNQRSEASAPANVRPSFSVSKSSERELVHNANRELPTQTVLGLLKAQLPQQYELAEIVGKWIWLDFPVRKHTAAANTLWRLGFHWNQRRCLWQHPCGAFAPYFVHSGDPRQKFGSRSVFTVNA
jgi:hypothetical protein